MKLTISQEDLNEAVSFVFSARDSKTSDPYLSSIMVNVKKGKAKLTATDLSIQKTAVVKCQSEQEFAFCFPAKKLSDFVKTEYKDKTITISIKDNKATLSGRKKWVVGVLPADMYPEFATFNNSEIAIIDSASLSNAIKKCSPSMGKQDSRRYLNSMFFEKKENTLNLVATDGHRLSSFRITTSGESFNKSMIVPRDSVMEISKILAADGDVSLSFADNGLFISVGNMAIKSKLIEGKYPDYRRVIPANNPFKVNLNTTETKQAVDGALLVASEKYKGIKLEFSEGALSVTAEGPDGDKSFEKIPCAMSGESIEIGFNITSFYQALARLWIYL